MSIWKTLFGKKRNFGAIPSPRDKKQKKVSQLFGLSRSFKVPEEYKSPYMGKIPVFDQGNSSTCVACSLSELKWVHEYTQAKNTNQQPNLSKFAPMFIYANRADGMYKGEGMVPSEALDMLQKCGVPREEDYKCSFGSYGQAVDFYNSHREAQQKAVANNIGAFYRCYTAKQVQKAVIEFGAVTVMFPVYKCLYEPTPEGNINYKRSASDGNHQMLIVGYDKTGWFVQNSWGIEYGNNGTVHIPYEYDFKEAWVVADA